MPAATTLKLAVEPAALVWFCGCTTVITLNHQSSDQYIDYLEKEVALLAPRLAPNRPGRRVEVVKRDGERIRHQAVRGPSVRGVGAISRVGGATREVRVELDPARLLALNASADILSSTFKPSRQAIR